VEVSFSCSSFLLCFCSQGSRANQAALTRPARDAGDDAARAGHEQRSTHRAGQAGQPSRRRSHSALTRCTGQGSTRTTSARYSYTEAWVRPAEVQARDARKLAAAGPRISRATHQASSPGAAPAGCTDRQQQIRLTN
jgi:hypothetical protein